MTVESGHKVVALISGGKDSTYNMMKCVQEGHAIVCLANLFPITKTEIDSHMYQSVGHECIETIARVMQLPLYRRGIKGKSIETEMEYKENEEDEIEDLYVLLKTIKEKYPELTAVSVGAIESTYQKNRVEHVCRRPDINLTPLCYLWKRDQEELLQEMFDNGIEAITVKVASCGMGESHLGKSLKELFPTLKKLHEKYEANICGEGGEYESLVLNCPLYREKLEIKETKPVVLTRDEVAPVVILQIELIPPKITPLENQVVLVE
ncbi:hypothetical protein FO519_002164 [Halicephalobus sp. NKZ332]|nr:hypothetical protein FO519_002164 [Halicephalobus sp. NKZ332]